MDQDALSQYIRDTFSDVSVAAPDEGPGAGDIFFTYADQDFPFATIVTKDYPAWDEASHLYRDGVFRLNVGVSRERFRELFPTDTEHDYTALDTLMPHPVYASQSWVSVLNPSRATFTSVEPLLAEAYALATRRGRGKQR